MRTEFSLRSPKRVVLIKTVKRKGKPSLDGGRAAGSKREMWVNEKYETQGEGERGEGSGRSRLERKYVNGKERVILSVEWRLREVAQPNSLRQRGKSSAN